MVSACPPVSQVERLVRAIYRPHNVYCLHVDINADNSHRQRMEEMASCLPTVFVSNVSVAVEWGRFTNLYPVSHGWVGG